MTLGRPSCQAECHQLLNSNLVICSFSSYAHFLIFFYIRSVKKLICGMFTKVRIQEQAIRKLSSKIIFKNFYKLPRLLHGLTLCGRHDCLVINTYFCFILSSQYSYMFVNFMIILFCTVTLIGLRKKLQDCRCACKHPKAHRKEYFCFDWRARCEWCGRMVVVRYLINTLYNFCCCFFSCIMLKGVCPPPRVQLKRRVICAHT